MRRRSFLRLKSGYAQDDNAVSITIQRNDPFFFRTFVATARCQVFVFLGSATGPIDYDAVNAVALLQTESHGQFRLGQITGTAFDDLRLGQATSKDAHHGADGVAVRLGALQTKADAAIPGQLIVAIEVSRSIVGSEQQVEIAVAIEIRIG